MQEKGADNAPICQSAIYLKEGNPGPCRSVVSPDMATSVWSWGTMEGHRLCSPNTEIKIWD